MKLKIPCNWDEALIDKYAHHTEVRSLYGKMDKDLIGGGRPTKIVQSLSKEDTERYIQKAVEAGFEFNYLLNSACLGNTVFTRQWKAEMIELLDWVVSTGAQRVTVALPYLVQMIKKRYPNLKITVSSFARVNTVKKALFFQDLGADEIALEFSTNRDFKMLEVMAKKTDLNLVLMTNLFCLYQCPYALFHANLNSHFSQVDGQDKENHSYCGFNCTRTFMENPAEIIRSPWIRPEDLILYEGIGIDSFKLVERISPTPWIMRVVDAYLNRRYNGNLMDLMSLKLPLLNQMYERYSGQISVLPDRDKIRAMMPVLDNHSLNGFAQTFLHRDCKNLDCRSCGFCDRIAEKYLNFPEPAQWRKAAQAFSEAIEILV